MRGPKSRTAWRVALSTALTSSIALAVAAPANAAATPEQVASGLIANDTALRKAVADWRGTAGDPPAGQAPVEVSAPALVLQEKVRLLAEKPKLVEQTIALLPAALASDVRALTSAAVKLGRLHGGGKARKLKVGKPEPLADLVGHYREAEAADNVDVHYLAAINLVETKFGRVKSNSTAGAKGPMQFIPGTWRIYGEGGDIQDLTMRSARPPACSATAAPPATTPAPSTRTTTRSSTSRPSRPMQS